jgi:hypothetical protein
LLDGMPARSARVRKVPGIESLGVFSRLDDNRRGSRNADLLVTSKRLRSLELVEVAREDYSVLDRHVGAPSQEW